jgi:co-chaperonin GroES (HSP10)
MSEAASVEVESVTAKAETSDNKDVESKPSQLPEPSGYKILIALPEVDEKTEGGIIKAQQTKQLEEVGSIVGFVMKLGPDAYQDKEKFPNGPYCKEGDFILMRSYSGTRFSIHDREFRLINDDSVEAIIDDPRGIRKI